MKRILIALVLGISLLFASGGFVYAQDYGKGVEAYEKGDFATALREWRPLAEQGDAMAQYNLGVMYDNGKRLSSQLRLYRVTKPHPYVARFYD